MRIESRLLRILFLPLRLVPIGLIEVIIWLFLLARTTGEDPKRALSLILSLDKRLYHMAGFQAIRLGGGRHVKDRLTGYIDYFVDRAKNCRGPYLDIGCSKGQIAGQLANVTSESIVGIDVNKQSIEEAKLQYRSENLLFICGDATEFNLKGNFRTVILSNVLEHISDRVNFLKQIALKYKPQHLLIRVPNFERDWRVPLKKELGLGYFLDPTHEIEHTPDEFVLEIEEAGYRIKSIKYRWGEIWAIVQPNS